jgi:hypothetical protein
LREKNRRNVVLTGPPRSGTTLCCHLLNKLPNTLALHEPIRPFGFVNPKAHPEEIREAMGRFFSRQRRFVRERGIAETKHVGGKIPTDPYAAARSSNEGIRYQLVRDGQEHGEIAVDREAYGPGFWLIIKDPATLSALLPVLVDGFPCYAVVRNPLAVLASWNSVNHAARDGHSPVAERYDETLKEKLAATSDRIERQLILLDWWFRRFRDHLPKANVIRYEDLARSGGAVLRKIVPAAHALQEPLESRNINPLYGRKETITISERLLESEGAYWSFYSRQDVEDLVQRTKVSPYARGYADAAAGRAARPQIPYEEGTVGLRAALDYYSGYGVAASDLIAGDDPAEVAKRFGWISLEEDLLPLAERHNRAYS